MTEQAMALAIDVGGTTLSAAIVNEDFQILDLEETPIDDRSFNDILVSTVDILLARDRKLFSKIACLGIGLPEYVSDGVVRSNLVVDWNTDTIIQLETLVSDLLGRSLPVCVESDVRCGAMGEFLARQEETRSSILYISWGTGISSTIVLKDGCCLIGARGEAISFGEWPICTPEADTLILEKYASGHGMAMQFKKLTGKDLNSIQIAELAENGDLAAKTFLQSVANILAGEIGKLSLVLDPDEIILGGGIGSSDSYVKRHLLDAYSHWKTGPEAAPLVSSRLADNSGIIGAAIFAFKKLEKKR